MAALTHNSGGAHFEPDEEWKQTLRRNIEAGLRPMVDAAQQKLDDALANGLVEPQARDRLTAEYLATLNTVRQRAEEQFRTALERERQERHWASTQQLDRAWSESLTKIRQQWQKQTEPHYEPNVTTRLIVQELCHPSLTPEEDMQMPCAKRARRSSTTSSMPPSFLNPTLPRSLDGMAVDMDCDRMSLRSTDQEWDRVEYIDDSAVYGREEGQRQEDPVKWQQVSKLMEMEIRRKEEEARQRQERVRWKENELDKWEEELRQREEDLDLREAKMHRRGQGR